MTTSPNTPTTAQSILIDSTINSIGMLHDVAGDNAAKAVNSPLFKSAQKFGVVGQVVTAPVSFVVETQINGLSTEQATIKITGGAVGSGFGAWGGAKIGAGTGAGFGTVIAGPAGTVVGGSIGAAIGFVAGSHLGNYFGGEVALGVYDAFPDVVLHN